MFRFLSNLIPIFSLLCFSFPFSVGIPTPQDYKVTELDKFGAKGLFFSFPYPLIFNILSIADNLYAGLMPLELGESNRLGNFFFWLAKQRNHDPSSPNSLVVWLNGGPGCSSMVGMMFENGPFTLAFGDAGKGEPRYNLKYNPYAWNEVSDVLFVEQPLRTGFAAAAYGTDQVHSEKQIGDNFRKFLLSFLQVFTEYKDVELYLTGESYAGFYIPWIADTIVKYQMKKNSYDNNFVRDTSIDHIRLAGIAIGNGVMDYLYQEPSYAEYAYSHGLIPLAAKKKFDLEWLDCLEKIRKSKRPLTRGSFDECSMMEKVLEAAGKPNEYNTATFTQYESIMKPVRIPFSSFLFFLLRINTFFRTQENPFNTFFQDPEIQAALHVRGTNLPGLNFYPENYQKVKNITFHEWNAGAMRGEMYYEPPGGWQVCNDAIVSVFSLSVFLKFFLQFVLLLFIFRTMPWSRITPSLWCRSCSSSPTSPLISAWRTVTIALEIIFAFYCILGSLI
jgi:hypothetical protein